MSTQTLLQPARPHIDGVEHAHDAHGSTKALGIWIYLMSDCILFGALFASYVVLNGAYAGGPTQKDIFELPYVLAETFVLLFSSITYGYAMLAMDRHDRGGVLRWIGVTFLLGLTFISMEVHEFHHLIVEGHGPNRSAFLSGFFALVGTHGLHVASGLIWMAVVWHQIWRRGFTATNMTRLVGLSLFWHFLDLVWICVFTIVYLFGAL